MKNRIWDLHCKPYLGFSKPVFGSFKTKHTFEKHTFGTQTRANSNIWAFKIRIWGAIKSKYVFLKTRNWIFKTRIWVFFCRNTG